ERGEQNEIGSTLNEAMKRVEQQNTNNSPSRTRRRPGLLDSRLPNIPLTSGLSLIKGLAQAERGVSCTGDEAAMAKTPGIVLQSGTDIVHAVGDLTRARRLLVDFPTHCVRRTGVDVALDTAVGQHTRAVEIDDRRSAAADLEGREVLDIHRAIVIDIGL